MNLKDEDMNVFTQLGLTTRQAEVYLTICKLEKATVKTCAKKLQIARAEIYRAVPSLEKRGLIQRIITTPTVFRAIPVTEGLSILLQRDVEKHTKIQAKAGEFAKKFNENNVKELSEEEPQCVLIFEGGHKRRDFVKRMENLQTSLDAIASWALLKHDVLRYTALFKKALERGVKIRHITDLPTGEEIPEVFYILKKAGSFEVKCVSTCPPTSLAIFDKKVATIITAQKGCIPELAILLSSNPRLATTYQDYFELKWHLARKKLAKTDQTKDIANRRSSSRVKTQS